MFSERDECGKPGTMITICTMLAIGLLCSLQPRALIAQVRGVVSGRIASAVSGQPLSDVRVEDRGSGAQTRSDTDGGFLLSGLEPGRHVLTFHTPGYAAARVEVAVENARQATVDVALSPSAITLAGMLVQAWRDTVAPNATTFDRTAIEASGKRDMADLLQAAPGVSMTRSGGPGQPAKISIRGSSASQVLILFDGVPLNSELSGSADLSTIALESVERVTVLTGSQSARYGPRAMAGVIEIVSRKSNSERSALLRAGALGEWELAGTFGGTPYGSSLLQSSSLTVNHRSTRGDFMYEVPAFRGGGVARRRNAASATTQIVGGVGLALGAAQLSLRGNAGATDRGMAGSIVQPSLSGRQHFMRWNGGATINADVGRWAVISTADVGQELGRLEDLTPPFSSAYSDTITATGVNIASSAKASWQHLGTALGIDIRKLQLQSNTLAEGAPAGQTQSGIWVSIASAAAPSVNTGVLRTSGEFTLRADRSSLHGSAQLSPRLSVRTEWEPVALSVSYGSGFSPPSISDQFFHEGVQVRANPELRPERTRHDIEARLSLRDIMLGPLSLSGDAAAFRADIDGMILWFPDFRFIWSPHNQNVVRRGWELRGAVRVPLLHLDIRGNLNRSDVSYSSTVLSGQVAYRPRTTASIVSSVNWHAVRGEVTTRQIGVRRTSPGSGLNSLPAYRVTDVLLSLSRPFGDMMLTPAITVENLFNRQASMLMDYPFPTRLWSISLRIRHSSTTHH